MLKQGLRFLLVLEKYLRNELHDFPTISSSWNEFSRFRHFAKCAVILILSSTKNAQLFSSLTLSCIVHSPTWCCIVQSPTWCCIVHPPTWSCTVNSPTWYCKVLLLAGVTVLLLLFHDIPMLVISIITVYDLKIKANAC